MEYFALYQSQRRFVSFQVEKWDKICSTAVQSVATPSSYYLYRLPQKDQITHICMVICAHKQPGAFPIKSRLRLGHPPPFPPSLAQLSASPPPRRTLC